jgi:hypothetical protein
MVKLKGAIYLSPVFVRLLISGFPVVPSSSHIDVETWGRTFAVTLSDICRANEVDLQLCPVVSIVNSVLQANSYKEILRNRRGLLKIER